MKWEKVKFADFIMLQRGYDLTRAQFKIGDYPVVSSTTIMGFHNEYKANAPGVVIGRSGTLGEVQFVNQNYWPHNTALYVKDFKGNVPRFVYYFLKNFGTEMAGGGSAVPTLNRNNLNILDIAIPNIKTQRRIADILSAYDDLIENNQKQIKLLEEAAQRLYKAWFVDFEPFRDGEFVDSELGPIPAGWRIGTFGEISRISSGKRPIKKAETKSADFMYPLIGASCVMGFTCDYLYDTPVIVTGRVGTHGIIQYFDEKCWPSDNTLVIQSDFLNFAYLYLQTIDFHSLNRGSTQPLITQTDIKKQLCPIAPTNILVDFEDKLYALRASIQNNLSQNQKLAQLRDILLPKLMSGEIEVEG